MKVLNCIQQKTNKVDVNITAYILQSTGGLEKSTGELSHISRDWKTNGEIKRASTK